MLIGGAGLALIGNAVLMVEGRHNSEDRSARERPAVHGVLPRLLSDLRDAAVCGGLLIGLSTFQAEFFNFGVPQFRLAVPAAADRRCGGDRAHRRPHLRRARRSAVGGRAPSLTSQKRLRIWSRQAQVAELVDALVPGTSGESRGGSSPLLGTNVSSLST